MSLKSKFRILICDDDPLFRTCAQKTLIQMGEVTLTTNSDEAQALLKSKPFDLLLLDIQIRTPQEGLQALPLLRKNFPDLIIIMCSGLKDYTAVREALRLGANDYLVKDFEQEDLSHVVQRTLDKKELTHTNELQNNEVLRLQNKHSLIGNSPAIQALRKTIDKIKHSPAHVLITGDTGTGKEVVARQLRGKSANGSLRPFVPIDASTIQSGTAESVLFGYEKGAFTGADQNKKGLFEEAHGGILYFDEISNMPLEIQPKLLRAIQEKEILHLGGSRPISLDFRVICATNKDLEALVKKGLFKEDLYQRLNVIPIHLPTLHERSEDIPLLLEHFISRHCKNIPTLCFSHEAIEVLQNYPWPGNIRELENLVCYLDSIVEADKVEPCDLPPRFRTSTPHSPQSTSINFYEKVAEFEKNLLKTEYQNHKGNISQMALAIGMDRSHLYSKLKEYKIHCPPQTKSN